MRVALVDAGGIGGLLDFIHSFLRLFTDTGHFIQDAVGWLTNALFPAQLQTWFLGTIGAPGARWDPDNIYEGVYRAVQGPGLVLAAVAAAIRLVRNSLDHRTPAGHSLADVLPRFLLAVFLIGIPGTQVSVGYRLIIWSVDASMLAAQDLFGIIFHASLMQGVPPGQGWFTHMFDVVSNAGRSAVAVVVGGIPLLIMVLYAVFLMIARTVMLGFCIATAPLCMATVAFDGRNRFFQWWIDVLIGALMTPLIFAVCIALSVTLASNVVSALVIGPILAFALMCGIENTRSRASICRR